MRLEIRISVILFFLIVLNNTVSADSYEFRHLTTKDGLSRNSVICIFQDSRGFLWFGTEDGLNRYDGYEFKVFRASENNNSLSHNWIWDITEDRDQNLWIATWHGLTKYDMKTGQFTKFFPDSLNSNSISGERPSSIFCGKDKYIWIATWGGGLNRYDTESGKFKSFHHISENIHTIPGDLVRYVFIDSRNRLWAGTWSGLAIADDPESDNLRFVRFTHNSNDPASIGSNRIKMVFEDSAGNIWIGTMGGGLNRFNEKDSSFVKFTHDKNNDSSISSNDITTIFEDTRHRLWIGTPEDGLNLLNPDKKSFTRIRNIPDDRNSLRNNSIYSIYEDRSGLLWIGAGGINILQVRNEIFKNFKHISKNKNSINYDNITCFLEMQNDKVLIGTKGGGLNFFDAVNGRCMSGISFPDNCKNINALAADRSGNIYVATAGKGLFRFLPEKSTVKQIKYIKGLNNPEILRFINSMCFTDNRFLWLATYDKGLIKYDVLKDSAFKFNNDTLPDYLLCVVAGSDNDIWIGSWGGGMYRLNKASGKLTTYGNITGDPLSIAGDMVYSILETKLKNKRMIWAGSDRGLSYMYPDENPQVTFRHLTTLDGLPGNYVMGILEDTFGNIWVSTNNGLSRFNTLTGKLRHFDETDNMQILEFNPGACLKLKNGKLLFGGMEGFVSINTEKIRPDNYRPPVVLTNFKVQNKEYPFGGSLQSAKKTILTYKQSFFSFEFAALDFSHPSKVNYFYRMKGFEPDWTDAGNRRYANYTNIPPGNYTFQVKAKTASGMKSSNVVSFNIKIKPPYWQTWWFRISASLLFLLILYGLYRLRIQKLLAIEKLRISIASDLHDDIGSALTRISIISEQLQTGKDGKKNSSALKNINTTSREVVSTMGDIVWSVDSRNDSLADLIDRMHDHAYTQLISKEIQVNFETSGFEKNKKLEVDKRQNIFYIFKEAVNNIVKHSGATEVTISLLNDHKKFRMEISDNGNSFNPEDIRRGNGIRNMRMRAERINAELNITSDNGTKIVLSMKNL